MSIIERALGKQRSSESVKKEHAPDGQQATHRRDLIASVAESSKERHLPRAPVELGLDTLRAQGVIPPEGASDRFQEQIRRIKRPLLEAATAWTDGVERPGANLIMVTSSVAGEGKTFVALNVALSIARERDLSVLLVDADVAKRHMSSVLKIEGQRGITDAIVDESVDPENLVIETEIPGLSCLSAGRPTTVAPELFSSHRMAKLVSALGQADRQRIVLFDTSPLLATNESVVLSRLVEQVILVVCAESTQQGLVMEAIESLDKTKSIRCVLNQTRINDLSEHYYAYGYYPHDRPTDA